jgi:AraC family transcriptional regulator
METFSIEFDPAWLGLSRGDPLFQRSFYWVGGSASLTTRSLAALWSDPNTSERKLAQATASFLGRAISQRDRKKPPWLATVRQLLLQDERLTIAELASRLDIHPRWLAHAYRQAAGEGLHETIVRLRCERAAHLLRSTDHAIAEIAADAGFCDQSHLNRSLRRLTGRTPAQIRGERVSLAQLATAA